MATVIAAIQIYDGLTPALSSISDVISMVTTKFKALGVASSNSIDIEFIKAARVELTKVESACDSLRAASSKSFDIKSIQEARVELTKVEKACDSLKVASSKSIDIKSIQEARVELTKVEKVYDSLKVASSNAINTSSIQAATMELKKMETTYDSIGDKAKQLANVQDEVKEKTDKNDGGGFLEKIKGMAAPIQAAFEKIGQLKLVDENVITGIKDKVFSALDPIRAKISEITSSDGFQSLINSIAGAISMVASIAAKVIDIFGMITGNWSALEPIFWGLVAAVGAYAAITAVQAIASWAAKVASDGLNMSLLANPITWIALAIGVLIGAIYRWVQSVGGVKVAWMIAMNAILTAWDWVKIGFITGVYWVLDLWDKLKLGMMIAGVGIANFMGDMKVNVLMILQKMVNGAIDIINEFIGLLNNIPGVSIEAIQHVTFGTNAQMENEAEKAAREAEVNDYREKIEADAAARDAKLLAEKNKAFNAAAERQAEIDVAKAEALASKDTTATDNNEKNIENTAENTASMANSMDISSDELKYMRDLAEQEVINRFTTAEIRVEMNNQNTISSNMDLDGVVTYLEDKLYETMVVTAEGVHV